MEGTIGTPPREKTHCRDSGQTCGGSSHVGQKLAQSLPSTEACMEARTPGLHMSLGQHTPNLGLVQQETSPGLMA